MALYFFDLRDDAEFVVDEQGVELRDTLVTRAVGTHQP